MHVVILIRPPIQPGCPDDHGQYCGNYEPCQVALDGLGIEAGSMSVGTVPSLLEHLSLPLRKILGLYGVHSHGERTVQKNSPTKAGMTA